MFKLLYACQIVCTFLDVKSTTALKYTEYSRFCLLCFSRKTRVNSSTWKVNMSRSEKVLSLGQLETDNVGYGDGWDPGL